jgi:hypothetical protein
MTPTAPDPGARWGRRSVLTASISLIPSFHLIESAAAPSDKPIRCVNWRLDRDAIGLYLPTRGTFYLQDPDGSEFIKELSFSEPSPQLIAIVGDWAGRGFDSVGLYDPATSEFRLKYNTVPGAPDVVFRFGTPGTGAMPVAGRWTGEGGGDSRVIRATIRCVSSAHCQRGGPARHRTAIR